MSTVLPEISGSRSPEGKSKKNALSSKFQPTSQARHGYLGHLCLQNSQEDPAQALRNITALDAPSFLPNVMTLQRASTPWQYNTPCRQLEGPLPTESSQMGDESPSRGSQMLNSTSRQSISASASAPMPANYVRRIRRKAQLSRNAHDYRQQIADLKMLADSASRSGNVYQALQAYHKMGVVFDNQGMYDEAIMKYKQFLALCITSKNTQGEALAYNCLGIDCFKMGQYDEAIQYHNKHLELADSTGRLIAHTNLGIVFQAMGLSEHAAIHHQHAIEYANRMGSKDAQCFTVGNLGIASAAQGDLQTSRICLQYHLSSAQRGSKSMAADNKFAQNTLKEVSKNAYHRLGQVNATDGRFDEAADHFAKAMEVAKSANQQKDEEVSLAMLGIARGMLSFDEHCAALVRHAEEAAIDADDVRNAT
ncbi:unnamed protein product [Durusdinium trenchii]|uniref:TPR-like protein n=1 Tax=Durusdinium trenchii TaxID=1381693 RepID=A0ABP0QPD1_9DINO